MDMTTLSQLFSPPGDPALLTYGIYNPWLVVLSVVVASFSSWMGLQMAGQSARAVNPKLRNAALLTGSLALGSGVWAMHFIGMLAFNLCTPVSYDPLITVISMLPSMAASWVALSLLGRQHMSWGRLLEGGVLVGAGIGAMHYSGMAAMRSALVLRYDPWIFGLSIVVAVALATLSLWVRYGLRGLRGHLSDRTLTLIAGVIMGCAIAGMHYTGMAAARFVGRVPIDPASGIANANFLSFAITLTTALFASLVLSFNWLLRYRALFRQLSQTASWMHTMLETAVDGVITMQADGTIRDFNAAGERIFGWKRQEVIGRNIRLLIAGPVMQSAPETLGLHKGGGHVPIRTAYGNALLADEQIYVCFVTDISQQKKMEEQLRDSERQFRSLIGNIPGISYRSLMLPGWPMVYVSDAIEPLTGYPAADFTGTPPLRVFGDLIHPDDHAQVAEGLRRAIEQKTSFTLEYRLCHHDGSIRWMWENGSAVTDERGKVLCLDGVILDISGRRRMEEDLRQAKEKAEQAAAARAAFLANMSHEIRTPMNSILGFTDVLLQGTLTAVQRRHLDTVRNAGRSLLRLLNEVLDTAKLDKGAVELELHDYSLLALIDELSSSMGSNATAKGLSLAVHYDPEVPGTLHGDELRVRQVLTNLLGNAVKFTSRGRVSLRVTREQNKGRDEVHIAVSDTGIGIPADRISAIFDPFTQADASMSRRYGGTGLGTTISKQLVELMGGRIWVESVEGEGSTFHVVLPLMLARSEAPRRPGQPVQLPPLRILAADDVPQNLEVLLLLLSKLGHSVTGASDGAVALHLASEAQFDLVLMDVQMPGMDGLEATRQLRKAEQQTGRRRTPVIAMTASVLDRDREATAEAGMDGFTSKPVDIVGLTVEIARVLGHTTDTRPDSAAAHAPPQAQVLNAVHGLQLWTGHEQAYLRALGVFAADNANAAGELTTAAASGRHAAGRMRAHQIRGAAANLGMEQLAQVLAKLEDALANEDRTALPALLDLASDCLADALAAARRAADGADNAESTGSAPGVSAAPDSDLLRRLGVKLKRSLDNGSFDQQAMTELTEALRGNAAPSRLADLQRAIDDFDFAGAQGQLETLLADYLPSDGGAS
ncbi:MHYT domain-containing protein [Pseudoduganella sp. RAF19]|uniref:MHYT domain-containing protein n=3 Tax=unclassified Pseudoduganella TaxID=2637179 RepID=UPI003F9E0761